MSVPSANLNATIKANQGTDADKIKRAGMAAREAWAEAQQGESRLKMATHDVGDVVGFETFDRVKKRKYRLRTARFANTEYSAQEYDRRVLMTSSFDDAFVADVEDLGDASSNVLADAKSEMKKAAGRTCDEQILFGITSAVLTTSQASTSVAASVDGAIDHSTRMTFLSSLSKKYQLNCVHLGEKTVSSKKRAADITSDSLEDIIELFGNRDVDDELNCALTPTLAKILRKDSDFKNSERVWNPSESIQKSRRSFMYKDINFIHISPSVMPAIGSENLGFNLTKTGASAETDASRAYAAKQIGSIVLTREIGNGVIPGEADVAPNMSLDKGATSGNPSSFTWSGDAVKTTTDVDAQALVAKSARVARLDKGAGRGLTYFWVSKALKFGTYSVGVFERESELPERSHAKSLYSRINFGCLNIDPDYALAVIYDAELIVSN